MYVRRLKSKVLKFDIPFSQTQRVIRPERRNNCHRICNEEENSSRIYPFPIPSKSFHVVFRQCGGLRHRNGGGSLWRYSLPRSYSSNGDGSSANEGKHLPMEGNSNIVEGKIQCNKASTEERHCEEHARLGLQDQKEWLSDKKFSFLDLTKESPFLTKRERFKNEFLNRVVPWEEISISWENFPYFLSENTKKLLVECAASHLKHKKLALSHGARLPSSSGRILLQGIPGTELYRERMVKALARDLQVPLMVLDSSILVPLVSSQSYDTESDVDDDNVESGEECASCSDDEEETCNEGENDNDGRSDETDEDNVDVHSPVEALKKIVPHVLDEFGIKISGEFEPECSSAAVESSEESSSQQCARPIRKGDRVKYAGDTVCTEGDKRPLLTGQRGEVYEIMGDKVAVILDSIEDMDHEEEKNGKDVENDGKPSVYWIHIHDIVHDLDTEAQDWYIALEALFKVLQSLKPIIVYFPEISQLSRAMTKSNRKEFLQKVEEIFGELEGPHVLICGKNKLETGKGKNKFMLLPQITQIGRLPIPVHRIAAGFRTNKPSKKNDLYKVFNNILSVAPPKEESALRTFHKQLDEDRRIIMSRNNLVQLHRVLVENELSCLELAQITTDDVTLTNEKAELVVGWARNHCLSSCIVPSIKNDQLVLPRQSLETAISRLKEQEKISKEPLQNLKIIAKDDYEKNFISAVVPANEIGIRFEDIGALEDVKKTLNELVALPMRRPELFSRGNLLRPCKGILLFGPPGTGKTLLAKALATESGANFISITGSTLTSKWFGDAEKLTKALFSFASRLAPVIIFVDEVDSLLGARGGAHEHEATRRMRNEFMAAWDGLRSKDNQRILVLGATNRPFDLDDAVIRRLPRRIYVDLPDVNNRIKILKIFLSQENLEPCFKYSELAKETEGYSGSDLKNLCIAAAYRPVQELLEEEKKEGGTKTASSLRPLNLSDFIQAKAKVGASVAFDATSMNELRKWNEQYGEGGSRRHTPFGFGD